MRASIMTFDIQNKSKVIKIARSHVILLSKRSQILVDLSALASDGQILHISWMLDSSWHSRLADTPPPMTSRLPSQGIMTRPRHSPCHVWPINGNPVKEKGISAWSVAGGGTHRFIRVAVKNFPAKNRNQIKCPCVLTSLAIQLYCTAADKILLYQMMRIHLDEYRISAARNVTKIRTTTSNNVISWHKCFLTMPTNAPKKWWNLLASAKGKCYIATFLCFLSLVQLSHSPICCFSFILLIDRGC
jgi:hypothetical protein